MLMLDGKDRVLGITNVGTGSLRQADVNTGKIAEECIIRKPSKVVFAHNHPSGSLEISINDHAATCTLELFVKQLGVEFLEHYIVADGKYVGIKMHEEKVKRTGEEIYLKTYGFGGEKE